ncbi:hypothetical protein R5R35_004657 [Gryllus longicercus]|uniref:Uncharacterized protein n=1 Tax=Gryllus longicercus TaxID=2509291 RepID=A0AAN9VYU7_9ORTH
MDEQELALAQSVFQVEEEVHERGTLKKVLKDEDDEELEPPATDFLELSVVKKEEYQEEYEDPLVMCVNGFPRAGEEMEERSCSSGSGSWRIDASFHV